MDASRHHSSPPSERFLGLFSSPPGTLAAASGGAGVELHEDEVLWTGPDLSAPSTPRSAAEASPRAGAMFSSSASSSRSFRRLPEKNFGILAALPVEEKGQAVRNPAFLQRNGASISSASTSPTSSARMIPVIPKPKHVDYSMSVPGGRIHHQSLPVNVPVVPRRQRRGPVEEADEDEGDDEEMLPPHEMVARKNSPLTTFSVLEGVGRTLKGRDLRRVRNAVWRQTGFVD
ncbi:hypothetical protein Taro_032855 [Colocasia esculenta]|uniref:Senescence regulator n=1 Tax=Colocasia esculenta TaxID=4460 RepID=A0A843W561_COLES|nr:hypothetical protein [Colocasia esculenta]